MKKSEKSAEQPAPEQQEQQQMQAPAQNNIEIDDPVLKPDVVRHNLEMQRIKAKMIADVTVELIKAFGSQTDPRGVADTAIVISTQALGY